MRHRRQDGWGGRMAGVMGVVAGLRVRSAAMAPEVPRHPVMAGEARKRIDWDCKSVKVGSGTKVLICGPMRRRQSGGRHRRKAQTSATLHGTSESNGKLWQASPLSSHTQVLHVRSQGTLCGVCTFAYISSFPGAMASREDEGIRCLEMRTRKSANRLQWRITPTSPIHPRPRGFLLQSEK